VDEIQVDSRLMGISTIVILATFIIDFVNLCTMGYRTSPWVQVLDAMCGHFARLIRRFF
jgi:uncharacterized protein YggT (Ycf19 family)